jgi:RNA polymerase sigma-70 factor (ECF subfamily)
MVLFLWQMENKIEKRRDPRVVIHLVSVDVCGFAATSTYSELCPILNLSSSGMKFEGKKPYEQGQNLRLTFTLPETTVSIRTNAAIIYQIKAGNRFETGVRFKDLGLAEQKMLRQVVDFLLTQSAQSGEPDSKKEEENTENPFNYLKPNEISSDSNIIREGDFEPIKIDSTSELLIKQCVAGVRRAQHDFFFKYRDTVLNLIYRLLGPDFDIDDVIQQVFISIFKSLESFKGLSSLDTWVYRITSKVCTDQLRKKYRKRKLTIAGSIDDDTSGLTGSTEHTPASKLERKELYNSINLALGKLTAEKRLVVIMYEIEGKSLEEIAEVIQKPVGTIKSRLFHARRELEKHLRKYVEITV